MSLWLVGGVDPTGGAGLLRDAWTLRRFEAGMEFACVATALTRQGTGLASVGRVTSPARMAELFARLPSPRAIKVGLVPAALVEVVSERLAATSVPIVLDPVLRATDGGALGASAEGLAEMTRLCTVVTPNVHEAVALTGGDRSDPQLAERVLALGPRAVLLKNLTRVPEGFVEDVLLGADDRVEFRRRARSTPDPRGTGCALATALAAGLAAGHELTAAVRSAIEWLDEARTHLGTGSDGQPHMA